MSEPIFREILEAMAQGRMIVTNHAQKRMYERNVTLEDLRNCGLTGKCEFDAEEGNYKIFGKDVDGADLKVIADFDGWTIIITVMGA